ncbi:MAG: hypothetical protein AAB463_02975 [Patescibacteria group bacterium]
MKYIAVEYVQLTKAITRITNNLAVAATLLIVGLVALLAGPGLISLMAGFASLAVCAYWGINFSVDVKRLEKLFTDTMELYEVYQPSQKRVDESLMLLAQELAAACEAQIRFYQNAPHYVASGVGTAMDALASPDEYDELASQNDCIQNVIAAKKEQFWTLHTRVKRAGFEVRPRWKDYLSVEVGKPEASST